MKKIVWLTILAYCVAGSIQAQSVGIGETNPLAKLEIKSGTTIYDSSAMRIKNSLNEVLMNIRDNGYTGIGTASPGCRLHLKNQFEVLRIEGSSPYISFFDGTGIYKGYLWQKGTVSMELGSSAGSNLPVTIAPNGIEDVSFYQGYTGIGNSNPSYRLDVSGRMRIRHAAETAGVWFNNSTNIGSAAFVGMNTDNTYGFYGNTGAGWSMLFNTGNGNTSIGSSPGAAKLSVFGSTSALEIGNVSPGGRALTISNGNIVVAGAGINSSTVAFVHKATTANSPVIAGYTVIDHPYCNNNPSAILLVTLNGTYGSGAIPGYEMLAETTGSAGTCQVLSATSFLVFYNGPNSGLYAASPAYARERWCIRTYDGCFITTPINLNFNVLVINN
jgi:hypothetical protein